MEAGFIYMYLYVHFVTYMCLCRYEHVNPCVRMCSLLTDTCMQSLNVYKILNTRCGRSSPKKSFKKNKFISSVNQNPLF